MMCRRRLSLRLAAGVLFVAAMCTGCRNHNMDIIRASVDGLNSPMVAAQLLVNDGVEGFNAAIEGDSLVMHLRVANAYVLNTSDPQSMAETMASTLRADRDSRPLVDALREEQIWLVVTVTDRGGQVVAHAAVSPDEL